MPTGNPPSQSGAAEDATSIDGPVCAVVLAAGSSNRFGSDKLAQATGGKPVWRRSFEAFRHHRDIDYVGLVASTANINELREAAPDADFVVLGGASRAQSSAAGLAACPPDAQVVLFHDAARPFVTPDLVARVVEGARRGPVFPGLPVTETIRQRDGEGFFTLDRSGLVSVQTPQGAPRAIWERSFQDADPAATDDMLLVERLGLRPAMVHGDVANRKLTYQSDLQVALEYRSGIGYDIHGFSTDPNRPMWIGGVEFADDRPGLEGHSDADVLLHAIVDALLGAAGLGDIGLHFPDTDAKWKDARSTDFLVHAADLLNGRNWLIMNIDATVVAERPKIMRRHGEICESVARAAGVTADRVSVKATTNERLGALGRGEGIAALAVATLARARP